MRVRWIFVGLVLAAFGCGSKSSNNGGDDVDASGGGDDGSGSGGVCGNCEAPLVCQPFSMTCQMPMGSCTTQAECTGGTYCDTAQGVCLPSSSGTPCDGPANCMGECIANICGCDGVSHQSELTGSPLDIFLVLDRTASMGADCAYTAGTTPPQASKACYATYALADYVTQVSPTTATTLAFDVMSLSNLCTGADYDPPDLAAVSLPVATTSALVQRISNENFAGGYGTRIEGALRGIAGYTTNHKAAGREMIGVLITDGDATNCQTSTTTLAGIISTHRTNTGIRTFIIGMEGATDSVLEQLAIAGGADPHNNFCGSLTPPCHFWSVGDGSGDALESALTAIAQQATPIPCTIDVTGLTPPPGEVLDYGKVNVTLTQGTTTTTFPAVPDAGSCPANQPAWYYDNPNSPSNIILCQPACTAVTDAGNGAELNVVAGCAGTIIL